MPKVFTFLFPLGNVATVGTRKKRGSLAPLAKGFAFLAAKRPRRLTKKPDFVLFATTVLNRIINFTKNQMNRTNSPEHLGFSIKIRR